MLQVTIKINADIEPEALQVHAPRQQLYSQIRCRCDAALLLPKGVTFPALAYNTHKRFGLRFDVRWKVNEREVTDVTNLCTNMCWTRR